MSRARTYSPVADLSVDEAAAHWIMLEIEGMDDAQRQQQRDWIAASPDRLHARP